MAKLPKAYTRLTRNAAGLGSYSSLWLGEGHLLIVRSNGYTESYTRLELRDLKAVFIVETGRRALWAVFWGIVVAWSGIVLGLTLQEGLTPVMSVFFALVGTIGLVANQFMGAGCRVYALTGVQTAPLPPLVRRPKARRALARLEPLIAQAQAGLARAIPAVPAAVPPVAEAPRAASAEAPPLG